MDLIKNILKMYESGGGHVEVLTASVRNMEHFLYTLSLGSDIITAPFQLINEWSQKRQVPENYQYDQKDLKSIVFQELDLNQDWKEFDISDELTDKGIEKFSADWNALIQ